MSNYNIVTLHDETINKPVTIGWDICGACSAHISQCQCYPEPVVPSYITNWNGPAKAQSYIPAKTEPAEYHMPEVRRVERDPRTGRKVRADKGLKRGPNSVGVEPELIKPERAKPVEGTKILLPGPCSLHTAEARMVAPGTYLCTVEGCAGVI